MEIQELKKKVQEVRDLENEYRKCCHVAKTGENAKNAFLEWIRTALYLFSNFYPADHTDYNWIRSQDFTGNGYDLYRVYVNINQKCSHMLAEIESGKAPLQGQEDSNQETPKKPLVFISHNSSQESFVTALVGLLENCGFTPDNLFCSSVPDFNIGFNNDIVETLKNKFLEHNLLVVFVLSNDFFKSAWCMNEVGAAWAMQADYSIIETESLDENTIDGVISKTKTRVSFKASEQNLSARMVELRNKLLGFVGLEMVSETSWNRYYKTFITQLSIDQNNDSKSLDSTNSSSSFLLTGTPDTIVQKAIDRLGEFTIKELQEATGMNYRYLLNKINAMVISGDLEAIGSKSRRRFMVKSHTI